MCKSLPYDPPTFPAALSKGERELNRVGVFEKRKKDCMEREQAMKAKADRTKASRRIKGSQKETCTGTVTPRAGVSSSDTSGRIRFSSIVV